MLRDKLNETMDALGVKSPAALGGTSLNLWIEVADVPQALAHYPGQRAHTSLVE